MKGLLSRERFEAVASGVLDDSIKRAGMETYKEYLELCQNPEFKNIIEGQLRNHLEAWSNAHGEFRRRPELAQAKKLTEVRSAFVLHLDMLMNLFLCYRLGFDSSADFLREWSVWKIETFYSLRSRVVFL